MDATAKGFGLNRPILCMYLIHRRLALLNFSVNSSLRSTTSMSTSVDLRNGYKKGYFYLRKESSSKCNILIIKFIFYNSVMLIA